MSYKCTKLNSMRLIASLHNIKWNELENRTEYFKLNDNPSLKFMINDMGLWYIDDHEKIWTLAKTHLMELLTGKIGVEIYCKE